MIIVGSNFFKRLARTFEKILYKTLQKLIGWNWCTYSGLFVFGIRVINVWFKGKSRIPVFNKDKIEDETSRLPMLWVYGMWSFSLLATNGPPQSTWSKWGEKVLVVFYQHWRYLIELSSPYILIISNSHDQIFQIPFSSPTMEIFSYVRPKSPLTQ